MSTTTTLHKLTDLLRHHGAITAPVVDKQPNGPNFCARWSKGMATFVGDGTDAVTDMGSIIAIVLHHDH